MDGLEVCAMAAPANAIAAAKTELSLATFISGLLLPRLDARDSRPNAWRHHPPPTARPKVELFRSTFDYFGGGEARRAAGSSILDDSRTPFFSKSLL
jgi:hypothetical protein